VFELNNLEIPSSSSSDSEPEDTRPTFDSLIRKFSKKPVEKPQEKFITILDVVPDDNEYGPRIPESMPPVIPFEEKIKIIPAAPQPEIVQLDSSTDSEDSGSYRPAKKHSKRSESRSEGKKRKKDKKHKSKKSKKGKKSSR